MQNRKRVSFIESMKAGQELLASAPGSHRQIAALFSDYGQALGEFTQGKVGVACVTEDGHRPVEGDFQVGVPMSIVLVSHVRPETPSPIVAGLEISQFGFPVMFRFRGSRQSAFNVEAVSDVLHSLAQSDVFASALHDLMRLEPEAVLYQS
ncbi:hypothetical protein G6L37_01235 [Agrobacterium rubi]|nr:hypothetical protein [Agrobacterium rubi]NTF24015.1 hypothetical protein [Agrobacterium rubi]